MWFLNNFAKRPEGNAFYPDETTELQIISTKALGRLSAVKQTLSNLGGPIRKPHLFLALAS
jgi:hypothetical protein